MLILLCNPLLSVFQLCRLKQGQSSKGNLLRICSPLRSPVPLCKRCRAWRDSVVDEQSSMHVMSTVTFTRSECMSKGHFLERTFTTTIQDVFSHTQSTPMISSTTFTLMRARTSRFWAVLAAHEDCLHEFNESFIRMMHFYTASYLL